ncbi:MAG: hypothetical protein KDB00_07970 [Planctomycetales bacterium]|nr:hypothetical protein [Planctomycetales bacterium]
MPSPDLTVTVKRPTWKHRRAKKHSVRRRSILRLEPLEHRLLLAQDILLAHGPTNSVLRFDGATGEQVGAFVSSGSGGLEAPWDPEFGPDGNLYVISNRAGAEKILRYSGDDGGFLDVFVDTGDGGFSGSSEIEFGPNGDLYVATIGSGGVLRFDGVTGNYVNSIAVGRVARATGIRFDDHGDLLVLDSEPLVGTLADRILKFDSVSGDFISELVPSGSLDDSATFEIDAYGNLYVAELTTRDVRRFNGTTGKPEGRLISSLGTDEFVYDVFIGNDGLVYLSTNHGVVRHDIETGQRIDQIIEGFSGTITQFPLVESPVDVNVIDVQHPAGLIQGEPVAITYEVRNDSTNAVSKSWDDVIYLSQDDIFDLRDIEIGRIRRESSLNPNDSYTETLVAETPSVPLGEYNVIVVSDRRGELIDGDRSNNVFVSAEPISVVQSIDPEHNRDRTIAVGRTLSVYTTDGLVADDEIEIRYTVYNRTPRIVENGLLAVTLSPNVILVSASTPSSPSGDSQIWSLGKIPAGQSKSVVLTVVRDSDTSNQIDERVDAFASLNGMAVHDGLAPIVLRDDPIDNALLAATTDADSTDPYVAGLAADLDQHPDKIVDFLRNEISFEAYAGSLRGARGTLWANSGNSLDEASLAVALLRASGIPARYARGTLAIETARDLILSMFPDPMQTVGFVPPDAILSDPGNETSLQLEVQEHFWFQMDLGAGWVDRDTSLSGTLPGTVLANVSGTFTQVPESLQHRVTVRLDVESYSQASAAFALTNGLSTVTVLEETYPSAALVGRPITVGHHVSSNAIAAAAVSAITHSYTPYLRIGDEALSLDRDVLTRDAVFQEVFTNFPLGNSVVTGLFLEIDIDSPGGIVERFSRTLFDRIGFASRNGVGGTTVSVSPDSAPSISPFDLFTVGVWTGERPFDSLNGPGLGAQSREEFPEFVNDVGTKTLADESTIAAELVNKMRDLLTAAQRLKIAEFELAASDVATSTGKVSLVRSYLNRPRVLIASSTMTIDGGQAKLSQQFDIRSTKQRVIAAPGQNIGVESTFNAERGFMENAIEAALFGDITDPLPGLDRPVSVRAIFDAAFDLGISPVTLLPGRVQDVDALNLSAEAVARISQALSQGRFVIVPGEMVPIGDQNHIGWFEGDADTGETVGVLENGTHGINETVAAYALELGHSDDLGLQVVGGYAAGLFGKHATLLVAKSFGAGIYKLFANDFNARQADLKNFVSVMLTASQTFLDRLYADLLTKRPAFAIGFGMGIVSNFYAAIDPPLPGALYDPMPFSPRHRQGSSGAIVQASRQGNSISADIETSSLRVEGDLLTSWSSDTITVLRATDVDIPSGEIFRDGISIGQGTINIVGNDTRDILVRGNTDYAVSGFGSVASYATAEIPDLAIATQWRHYEARLTGDVELALASESIMFGGAVLPPGDYLIRTTLADVSGSGEISTSAPTIDVHAQRSSLAIGSSQQDASISGVPLELRTGAAVNGFAGQITIWDQGILDAILIDGTLQHVVSIAGPPNALTVSPGGSISFPIDVDSNIDSSYIVHAAAQVNWLVQTDQDSQVTVTPPAGITPGIYTVRIAAQSLADPKLMVYADVPVEVTALQGGLAVDVVKDDLLFIPIGGAQVATSFRATIHNETSQPHVFDINTAMSAAGFEVIASGNHVEVPSGGIATVGLYLNPTGMVPPVGSDASFDVTVTSRSNGAVTQTVTVPFVVPEIHGLVLSTDTDKFRTSPGLAVDTELTIQSSGNVPQTVELAALLPDGLDLFGLENVTLNPGESVTQFLTLQPRFDVDLHSTLTTSITADFGGGVPQSRLIRLDIVAPGAEAAGNAAIEVRKTPGNDPLADRLDDLRIGITNKIQTPANEFFAMQIIAALDGIIQLLSVDPYLSPLADDFAGSRDQFAVATTEQECLDAVIGLEEILENLTDRVIEIRRRDFELFLTPNVQTTLPNVPRQFEIQLHNIGTDETIYSIDIAGLPPSVNRQLSQSSVVLGRDEFASVTLTLTETAPDQLNAFDFTVTARVSGSFAEFAKNTIGALRVRREVVTVTGITVDPPFVDPGESIHLSARLLNSVNRAQHAAVYYAVKDSDGTEVLSTFAAPTSVELTVQTSLADVDLGVLDTTGLPLGQYTIEVYVLDDHDQPIPGAAAQDAILIGSPVIATYVIDRAQLPPGTSTVNHTLHVSAAPVSGTPFELLSVIPVDDPNSNNDLQGEIVDGVVPNGDIIYVLGPGGIQSIDVSDPTQPQHLAIVSNRRHSVGEVVGDRLVTAHVGETAIFNFGNLFQFNIFSLSGNGTPELPALSNFSNPNYPFAHDLVINGDRVYIPHFYFRVNDSTGDYIFQSGGIISFDLNDSNLTPLAFPNNNGDYTQAPVGYSGGDYINFQSVLADSDTLYTLSTTGFLNNTTGPGESVNTDVNGNPSVGRILLYDVSDPASLSFVGDQNPATTGFVIPGTQFLGGIGIDGDLAFVLGAEGGWAEPYASRDEIGATGNIVLTTLDISDPRQPQILHSQTLDRYGRRAEMVQSLGNNHFLFTSDGAIGDTPKLFVIDATDPTNLVVTHEIDLPGHPIGKKPAIVDGSLLYVNVDDALLIYSLGNLGSTPVSVQVPIPNDNGVQLDFGSFNVPPDRISSDSHSDVLVWEFDFDAGFTEQTLQFQTIVNDIQPGQSRQVSRESIVQFRAPASGEILLSAASVYSDHILSIDPAGSSVAAGVPVGYTVTLLNNEPISVTYDLSIVGLNDSWFSFPDQVTIGAGGSVDVPLSITASPKTLDGEFEFAVIASSAGVSDSVAGTITISGQPVVPDGQGDSHGVVVQVTAIHSVVGQGGSATFEIDLATAGSVTESFALSTIGLPAEFGTAFLQNNSVITQIDLSPGASNSRRVLLRVTTPDGTLPDDYDFELVATSVDVPQIDDRAVATVTVSELGVDVIVDSTTVQAGQSYDVTVTNTGQLEETFQLSLAAPAGLDAQLSSTSVTLGAGQSQVISLQIGAIDYANPGVMELLVVAESVSQPQVRDVESVGIPIDGRLGVSANFQRDQVQLVEPGATTSVLYVDNLGNVTDQYSASIIATGGDVRASLRGVDGASIQTLPLMIVPGFGRAAIVLDATLGSFSSAAVTVQVRSLTDNSVVAEDTVTIATNSELDFGDAPEGIFVGGVQRNYSTRLINDGARHVVVPDGPILGTKIDGEFDGQPSVLADGDLDDEDGVVQIATLVTTSIGENLGSFFVVASETAKLDAWIDFNRNGIFDHPGEHLGQGVSLDLVSGGNIVPVSIPAGSSVGTTYARFRISSLGNLAPFGLSSDGEVEDYAIEIVDGDIGSAVQWDLVAGRLDAESDNDAVVVMHGQAEVFRAPGTAINRFTVTGTAGDDTFGIGNLNASISDTTPWDYFGGDGMDTLLLTGSNQHLEVTSDGLVNLTDIETIDLVGSGSNSLSIDGASLVGTTDQGNRLLIVHDENDVIQYRDSNWSVRQPIFVDGNQRHVLINGSGVVEALNTRPWTNPLSPTDVNFSGETTPLDALLVINFLARSGMDSVPLVAPDSVQNLVGQYYDTNSSLFASPLDALLAINFIARMQNSGEGEWIAGGSFNSLPESTVQSDHLDYLVDPTRRRRSFTDLQALDWVLEHSVELLPF